jgi:hypothetical protein
MAAYRATEWIRCALDSIRRQQQSVGWAYSLRIGVDGCDETSELLLYEHEPHWFSPKNVGPYVMRNSLIALAPASAYAVFDADDVMMPEYLTTLLRWMGDGVAGGSRLRADPSGAVTSGRRVPYQSGVALFSHRAWERLGGYRAWPIAADHDLILRAKALGISVTRPRRPIYLRRTHKGSLTQDPVTGYGTHARAGFADLAKRLTASGHLYVEPVTTVLEYREP